MTVRKHPGRWLCTLAAPNGKKSYRTFRLKKDALDFDASGHVEIRKGDFVHKRDDITINEAAALWLKSCEEDGLERSTTDRYRQYAELHIKPIIGHLKLNELSLPALRSFQSELRKKGGSPALVKGATTALCGILSEAQEQGLAMRNIVKEKPRKKRGNATVRHKPRLEAGKDIPLPAEIARFCEALAKSHLRRWRPLLLTLTFSGIRISEARGLRWCDLDLEKGLLHVRQRADRYNEIGSPKSGKSARRIPLPDDVTQELREHKMRTSFCKPDDLVFPNGAGNVENLANVRNRGLVPAWCEAGIIGRYQGLHSLRHWFASWCANRKADGGLELPMKTVQERMGHSSILITAECYSHIFPVQAAD